ncbi:MAG: Mg2+/Co2+ transporter CorB, partial [Alphaproteobacteria bacterium]
GQGQGTAYAVEELRGAIALHSGDSQDSRHERIMLHSILDLGDVEVGDVMIHRSNMVTVDAALPPAEIVREVVASPYTRIPIWRDKPDNIVGVLHAKALLKAVEEHPGDHKDLDIAGLAAEPWFIPETTDLLAQLQAFRRRGEHFALVVDEYGDLMGIVTLEDILEEIVGDISDETDVPRRGIRPQPNGTVIADGDVTLRDLNRRFDWGLPDEEAATIAGLVLHESRLIPEPGQIFTFHNFHFEVLGRKGNRLTAIRVTPPKPVAQS